MPLTQLSPTITAMIRMDHTHAFAAFHRFHVGLSPERKRALVTHVCLALNIHAQLEEEIFYPALREVLQDDDPLKAEVLEKSEPEHAEMKKLIGELQWLSPRDSAFDDTFLRLMRAVIHHVADEETVLLPAAERLLANELRPLGSSMTKRRLELLAPHAGEAAITGAQTFPVATATLALGAALGLWWLTRSQPAPARRWLG